MPNNIIKHTIGHSAVIEFGFFGTAFTGQTSGSTDNTTELNMAKNLFSGTTATDIVFGSSTGADEATLTSNGTNLYVPLGTGRKTATEARDAAFIALNADTSTWLGTSESATTTGIWSKNYYGPDHVSLVWHQTVDANLPFPISNNANATKLHYANSVHEYTLSDTTIYLTPRTAALEEYELIFTVADATIENDADWQIGKVIAGDASSGADVITPDWYGTIISRYNNQGAAANRWTFQILIQHGVEDLKTAQTNNGGNNLNNHSIVSQFRDQISFTQNAYIVDAVTAGDVNQSYTAFGPTPVTNTDLLGPVITEFQTQTVVDYIDVNYTIANYNLGNALGLNISGFSDGDINPTNTSQTTLRFQNDGNTGYWGHIGGTASLFGQTSDNGGRPFGTNWSEWADLLLEAINTPADAPFSNPTITSNDFWPYTGEKIINGTDWHNKGNT